MGEVAHVGAALLLTHRDAVQAERAHRGPKVAGELVGAVDLGGDGRDAVEAEGADRLAQRVDLLAERVVELGDGGGVRDHGVWASSAARLSRSARRMIFPVAVCGRLSAKRMSRG